jgi:hypothetical protein
VHPQILQIANVLIACLTEIKVSEGFARRLAAVFRPPLQWQEYPTTGRWPARDDWDRSALDIRLLDPPGARSGQTTRGDRTELTDSLLADP